MRSFAFILLAALVNSSAARSQPTLAPTSLDARIRQIDYLPSRVFAITVTPGYQLTVNLAPDEHIQTVAIGNSGTFQVNASHNGSTLFIKALQPGAVTNMTVATDVREYAFTVTAGASETPEVYTIDFKYPHPIPMVSTPAKASGSYRLAGSKSLWPTRIADDGEHVFIDWPSNVELPAIYALDGQGQESLTNGMMRGDHMVIDAIAPRLIFRLDREVATAVRYVPKVRKR